MRLATPNKERILQVLTNLVVNSIKYGKEGGYTKVKVDSIDPHDHEENGWRSFNGEFRTNFMLPNFIGFGNGITRGFGSIFSLNHPNNLEFQIVIVSL